MKVTISNRLKQIMHERGLKQVDILNKTLPLQVKHNVRLAKNDLSQYVNGKVEPNQDRIFILAKALDVSEAWLLGYDVPKERIEKEEIKDVSTIYNQLKEDRQQKVYDFAEKQLKEQNNVLEFPDKEILRGRSSAAGSALYVDDADVRHDVLSSSLVPSGADELVEIKGHSMEPLINNGDEVYIRYQPTVENGEIAIVRIENEGVTCKRVYVGGDTVTLKSENEEYSDMHFAPSEVTILGKVLIK